MPDISQSVPFITLPLGATEDRVLGTLDLQQALKSARRVFQPAYWQLRTAAYFI